MKMIFRYLKPYKIRVIITLIVKFLGTIFDLFIPWILEHIIDNVIPSLEGTRNMVPVFGWGSLMILCAILAFFLSVFSNRSASKVANDVTRELRQDLYEHIFELSCKEIDRFTISSMISRLSSDTYHIRNMLGMTLRVGVRAPILLIGGVFMTLMLDSALALIMIATLPFIGALIVFLTRKGFPLYTNVQGAVDSLVLKVREFFTGIRVIKALSQTEKEKISFGIINKELVLREKKASLTMGLTNPTITLLLNVALSVVLMVGAYRVNSGLSETGKIIAFMTYFTIISNAMTMINRIFVNFTKGGASAKRIEDVFKSTSEIKIQPEDVVETDNFIEFDGVYFSYDTRSSVKTLTDINFSLKRGETLGIIGETGSGKSTVIQLLLKLYAPDNGVIRLNGRNIASMSEAEIRRKIGVTFQNDFFMADTISENISLGRDIDQEEIEIAATFACAKEFISGKENAFQHKLEPRAANLSGGQKQRILVARALADSPEIIILDDASSALDYKTDAALRSAINGNFNNSAKIIVAQRISSIRHADKILVLDHGRVSGYGNHDFLMSNCEHYKEIAKSQNREVEM